MHILVRLCTFQIKQKIPHLVEVLTFVEIYIYIENNSNASKKSDGNPK